MRWFDDWKKTTVLICLIFFGVFPLITQDSYWIHVFSMFFLWAIVAANWNLVMGYAGIWSMANVAFFVIGGYASAILNTHLGWPTYVSMPLGGLFSMLVTIIFIVLPSLRLQGIYIALLTMMFVFSMPNLTTIFRDVTGGSIGVINLDPLFEGASRIHLYYVHLALFIVLLFVVYRTIKSSTGLAFMALRDSPKLATALGVSEYREKFKVFAMCAFFTGLVGAFYAHYNGQISPAMLGIWPFIMTFAMVVLGGTGRFPGAVLGAAFIVFGGEYLRLFLTLRFALVGGLVIVVILFFPGGLMEIVDIVDAKIGKWRKKRLAL